MIDIMIVDDHKLLRQGIKELISKTNGVRVIAEASNGIEAIDILSNVKPDIILLDINMPLLNGIETLKQIKSSVGFKVKIIILTSYPSKNNIIRAIKFGANGFVTKDESFTKLLEVIKDVNNNKNYLAPSLTKFLYERGDKSIKDKESLSKIELLSSREYEILEFISLGYSNIEIAKALFISEKTVKNHITNIYSKIEVDNRVQAVIFCYENKIRE